MSAQEAPTALKPLLTDQVRRWAEERPEALALQWEDGALTYAELQQRLFKLANGLAARGIGEGDRVAILDKNGPAHVELLLAAPLIGAVAAPANFRLADPEVEAVLRDAQAKLLVVGAEFLPVAEKAAAALDGLELLVLQAPEDPRSYEAWLEEQPADDLGRVCARDETAAQMYSSGTTGLPKGIELTHGNLAASLSGYDSFAKFTPDSVNLAALPMFHIGGGGVALAGLYAGVANRLVRDIVPNQLLDVIEQEGITHAALVPAVIGFLMQVPGVEQRDFSRFRACLYGASPISPAMLTKAVRLFGCDFSQGYGLTETTGISVLLPPEDHDPDGPNVHRMRSTGRPVNGMEIQIVLPGTSEPAPTGEIGEIWLRGPNVMKGYFNNPEATAEALVEDGWFRSGDAGRLDEEGYLFIEDRIKDMIISGGENVYPFEVESVLLDHPAVRDVAVIAVPHERWGETPRAMVVLEPEQQLTGEEVIAFTCEHLARFKCPTGVDFIPELPRSPAGKVLKKELRKPFWEGQDRQVG